MKLLLLCLGLWFTSLALAFEYQIDEKRILNPSILDAHDLKEHFSSKGLKTFSDTSLLKAGLPFDQLFVSYLWNQSVVLKAGLKVPKDLEGKIIAQSSMDLLVFHFRYRDTPYMLLAFNMKADELKEMVRPWLKDEGISFWSLLFPKAYANTCEFDASPVVPLHQTSNSISSHEIMKKIGQCGMDALKGVGDSLSSSLDFFKTLATNPKELWAETKAAFVQLKSFVLNIKTELNGIFQNLSQIDLNQKLKLACSFTGSLVTAAVQGLVMGPGATARLIPALMQKLKKTSDYIEKIARLRHRGHPNLDEEKLIVEVMSCAR